MDCFPTRYSIMWKVVISVGIRDDVMTIYERDINEITVRQDNTCHVSL